MQNLQQLNEFWSDYQGRSWNPKVTYDYSPKQEDLKNQIQLAIVFWSFVRNEVNLDSRMVFCAQYVSNENKFIRLIAHIEQLPNRVWRKLLWAENMDFLSYESFLRRITPDQEASIYEAYDALNADQPRFPKCFTKTFFDYLRLIFYFITPMRLKNSEFGESGRYYSKGAWAFNLLSMDFGFSLYPNGVDNDRQITNKKFSRFLSIKEHIHDFIVNQEDGIYWWLYKTVRSNFVWFPDKNVQLKTHVCPGFWFTLIMHAMFWFVSPIVFGSIIIHAVEVGKFEFTFSNIILTLFFSLTPLWVLAASFKLFLYAIMGLAFLIVEGIKLVFPKFGIFLSKISTPFKWIFKKFIYPFIEFFALFFATQELKQFGRFLKRMSKYALYLAGGFILGRLLYWLSPYIFSFLKWVYGYITSICDFIALTAINHTASFLWGVIGIFVIIFGFYLSLNTGFDESKYAHKDKLIRKCIKVWFVVFLVLGYLTIKNEEIISYSGYSASWAIMINIFSFMVASMLYAITTQINMETLDTRIEAKDKANFMVNSFVKVKKTKEIPGMVSKFRKMILNNEWLVKINHDSYVQMSYKLKDMAWKNYHFDKDEMSIFFGFVIPRLNQKVFEKLVKPVDFIKNEDRKIKLEFMILLCDESYSHADAVRLIKKSIHRNSEDWKRKEEAKKKRQEKLNAFRDWGYKWIATPIIFVFNIILWPIEKIIELIVALFRFIGRFALVIKDLYVLFNERCPYVSKSKYLE